MKQRWLARIVALCLAVMLSVPVYAEETQITAEATAAPEETVVPMTLEEPEENVENEDAVDIENADLLAETSAPEEISEPETQVPEETSEAEETASPESTETVSEGASPEPSASVEATDVPEQTASPEPTSTPEAPSELTSGSFTMKINEDNTLQLIAWAGEEDSVTVPDEAEGMRVVSIAASAFSGNEKVKKIVVPAGVIIIESGAFSGCSALTEITVPDSLEKAGNIFDGCSALETLRLNISNEITMTAADRYTREIVEIVDEIEQRRTVSVSFDRAFTDYCVLDDGHWHVEGAVRIEKGHAGSVSSDGALTIAESGSIAVLGSLGCAGAVVNDGSIIACAGEVSGVENVIREHSWLAGECSVCGELQTILLDVEVLRETFEKTYDGTSGIDVSAEDFVLSGEIEGDDVSIAAISSDFNRKDAGSYLANISFVLSGENAWRYAVKQVEIAVVIHPKRVTVTPRSGQGKVYGEKDPALSAGYKGTVSGEVLQGSLSREKGESAGKYAILPGTLNKMNPNYDIVLSETYFEISRKSMSDSSIKMGKVSNQRYSGEAIEPSVEIYDGSALLKQGVDYAVSYSDNTTVGTAQMEITGIGNYSGSRSTSFQIIKVSSGSSESSLSDSSETGVSLDELNDFGSAGTLIDENDPVSRDTLIIDEKDFGNLLFDAEGLPLEFVQSERMLEDAENLYSILTITAQELLNDFGIPLKDDFGQVRMRLSMDMVHAIQNAGFTHVELIVGETEMRIPLATLYAEFISTEGTLTVDCYEARLWMMKDEELTDVQRTAIDSWVLSMQPVHFELLAVPKTDETEIAEPVDVLSLLDDVELLFVPDAVPDYENTPYSVLRVDDGDPDTQHEPAGAMFILDGERVKARLYPLFGGMYALAARQ